MGVVKKHITGVATLILGMTLTGCSGEPAEQDIEQALTAEFANINALEVTMVGAKAAAENVINISAVKKLGCEKDEEDNAFICEVEVSLADMKGEHRKGISRIRMAKDDGVWIVIKQL